MVSPDKVQIEAERKEDENYKFRAYLKSHADEDELDRQFLVLHKELFDNYDCSKCRNCCKMYKGSIPTEDVEKDAEYLGITVEQFVDEFLPTSRDFYVENGRHYGPSPYVYFIGNPKSSASYGCMAPVIETALRACVDDSYTVSNLTDTSLEELCDQYIDNDIPVILWATIHMRETNPISSWYLSDGTRFTWPGNEHCMLLVGYDDTQYYFNDPYTGKLVAYDKTLTKDRFAELGRQAVAVFPR